MLNQCASTFTFQNQFRAFYFLSFSFLVATQQMSRSTLHDMFKWQSTPAHCSSCIQTILNTLEVLKAFESLDLTERIRISATLLRQDSCPVESPEAEATANASNWRGIAKLGSAITSTAS
jgi:hypothetical protein